MKCRYLYEYIQILNKSYVHILYFLTSYGTTWMRWRKLSRCWGITGWCLTAMVLIQRNKCWSIGVPDSWKLKRVMSRYLTLLVWDVPVCERLCYLYCTCRLGILEVTFLKSLISINLHLFRMSLTWTMMLAYKPRRAEGCWNSPFWSARSWSLWREQPRRRFFGGLFGSWWCECWRSIKRYQQKVYATAKVY